MRFGKVFAKSPRSQWVKMAFYDNAFDHKTDSDSDSDHCVFSAAIII